MDIGGHDAHNTSQLSILSARPGRIETEFLIGKEHRTCVAYAVNRAGTLHGGLITTLVDSVGSLAVASKGWFHTGISTDIHATFVKPGGRQGDKVRVLGEVVSMGTLHAHLQQAKHSHTHASSCKTRIRKRCLVRTSVSHTAYGSHTKYIRTGLGAKENVAFDAAGEHVVEGTLPESV